jgi:hypothetical protein
LFYFWSLEANVVTEMRKLRDSISTSPKRAEEDEEPIRLSKYSGGYPPDPNKPIRIESPDWPSPSYSASEFDIGARSRSMSNRKSTLAHLTDYIDSSLKLDENRTREPFKILNKNKVYDDDFNDYTLKFKKYQPDVNDCDIDFESQAKKETSIKRDLEELDKLEKKSGMAKIFGIMMKVCSTYLSDSNIINTRLNFILDH